VTLARAASALPAILTTGLTKRFGSVTALDGLDLEVPPGSVFGLLGPNGAGKTTTIRLLTGLATPTAGSATVAGIDVRNRRAAASLHRRLGVLDQEPRFYGWMTGRELLQFVGGLLGLESSALSTAVGETLERVGLEEAADRRVATYSAGMRQRLGIGQAILGRPDILILDEPVSSLDPEGRRDLLELIAELRETATVVVSSHVLADVERICERVAILDHGRLVIESAIPELLTRFAPPAYRVQFDPGQELGVEVIVDAIRREPWASDIEVLGYMLRIRVSDPDTADRRILQMLATAGLRISSFERERPSLEDVFLELVGHHRGAEDAA
jgi:ABC-2 type transport system ATP-binding protein